MKRDRRQRPASLFCGLGFALLMSGGLGVAAAAEPGVRVQRSYDYFDVNLASMPELNSVIRERRASGVDWFGQLRPRFQWTVPVDSRGGCRLQLARIDLSMTVVLPRLAPGVRLSARDSMRWRELVEHIEGHEQEHARIATDGAHRMLRAIRDSDCRNWQAAANREVRLMDQRQQDFDRSDRSANQTRYSHAVEPDRRSAQEQAREESLNGVPVEWTVGD